MVIEEGEHHGSCESSSNAKKLDAAKHSLVGALELPDLRLQASHPLGVIGHRPGPLARVDVRLLHPTPQRVGFTPHPRHWDSGLYLDR